MLIVVRRRRKTDLSAERGAHDEKKEKRRKAAHFEWGVGGTLAQDGRHESAMHATSRTYVIRRRATRGSWSARWPAYRQGRGDFADYVIREQALAAGASGVVTLDRVLKGESDFQLLGA